MSSGNDGKASDCLSRIVDITDILSYVSTTYCSLNRVNLWLLFYRWFPCGMSGECKKLPDFIIYVPVSRKVQKI